MIEYAIWDSAAEAVQAGVTPQAGDCGALWALACTVGCLDRAHRSLLENALAGHQLPGQYAERVAYGGGGACRQFGRP